MYFVRRIVIVCHLPSSRSCLFRRMADETCSIKTRQSRIRVGVYCDTLYLASPAPSFFAWGKIVPHHMMPGLLVLSEETLTNDLTTQGSDDELPC